MKQVLLQRSDGSQLQLGFCKDVRKFIRKYPEFTPTTFAGTNTIHGRHKIYGLCTVVSRTIYKDEMCLMKAVL